MGPITRSMSKAKTASKNAESSGNGKGVVAEQKQGHPPRSKLNLNPENFRNFINKSNRSNFDIFKNNINTDSILSDASKKERIRINDALTSSNTHTNLQKSNKSKSMRTIGTFNRFKSPRRDNMGFVIPEGEPLRAINSKKKALLDQIGKSLDELIIFSKDRGKVMLRIKNYIENKMNNGPNMAESFPAPSTIYNRVVDHPSYAGEFVGLNSFGNQSLGQFNRPVYVLKDWTIQKKSNKMFITLMGKLIDKSSRKILNKCYKTGLVLKRMSGSHVVTIESDYLLEGKFLDPKKKVPYPIKVFFESNKFPENWRKLTKKWQAIQRRSMSKTNHNIEDNREYHDSSQSSDEFEPMDEDIYSDASFCSLLEENLLVNEADIVNISRNINEKLYRRLIPLRKERKIIPASSLIQDNDLSPMFYAPKIRVHFQVPRFRNVIGHSVRTTNKPNSPQG